MNQSMEITIPCISTEKKNRLGREGYALSFFLAFSPSPASTTPVSNSNHCFLTSSPPPPQNNVVPHLHNRIKIVGSHLEVTPSRGHFRKTLSLKPK